MEQDGSSVTDKSAEYAKYAVEHIDEVVRDLFYLRGQPVKLTDYQTKFIKAVLGRQYRKYVFRACTRTGKTESTSILAVLLGVVFSHEEIVVMAHEFRQAEKLFRNIRDYIMNSPKLRDFVDFEKPFRMDEMNLINGTIIRCLSPSNPNASLGFGATVLILDEATSIPDEIYRTRLIRMLAGTAGRQTPILILLGTSHTMNFMYSVDTDISPDIYHQRVSWEDGVKAGILDAKVVEDAKQSMSDTEFQMWMEGEWVNAGDVLFDMKKVRNCMVNEQQEVRDPAYEYFMAVDVARLGNDETAVTVFSMPLNVKWEEATIQQVACYTRRKRPIGDTIGWLKELILKWQPVKVAVDETGLGAGVLDLLTEQFGALIHGLKTVGQERTDIYMALADFIDHGRILLQKNEKLYNQLSTFGINYTAAGKRTITKQEHVTDDLADATCFCAYLIRSYRTEDVYFMENIARSPQFTAQKAQFGPMLGRDKNTGGI